MGQKFNFILRIWKFFNNLQLTKLSSLYMSNQKTSSDQKKWSAEQECFIKILYEEKQIRSWKVIAKMFNKQFKTYERNPKQCRDRYINYIKFQVKNGESQEWSPSQTKMLFQKYSIHGSKWCLIAKQINKKSENCIKNRFYNSLRKFIRKINKLVKQEKKQKRKPFRYSFLIKILQFSRILSSSHGNIATDLKTKLEYFESLRVKIIQNIYLCQEGLQNEENIINVIEQMIVFCKDTKFVVQNKKNRVRETQEYLDRLHQNSLEGQIHEKKQIEPQNYDSEIFNTESPYFSEKELELESQRFFTEQPNSQLRIIDEGNLKMPLKSVGVWEQQLNISVNGYLPQNFRTFL